MIIPCKQLTLATKGSLGEKGIETKQLTEHERSELFQRDLRGLIEKQRNLITHMIP